MKAFPAATVPHGVNDGLGPDQQTTVPLTKVSDLHGRQAFRHLLFQGRFRFSVAVSPYCALLLADF